MGIAGGVAVGGIGDGGAGIVGASAGGETAAGEKVASLRVGVTTLPGVAGSSSDELSSSIASL